MQAQDIMTKDVISAAANATVKQVADLMMDNHISAVPILDDNGAIIGVISEGDLLRRVEGFAQTNKSWWLSLFSEPQNSAAHFVEVRAKYAKDIMTREVATVAPDAPVGEVARLLEEKRIKRVPVVDGGRLVGIVSRANLMHAIAAQPVVKFHDRASDREKRHMVLAALAEVPGLNVGQLNVVVEGEQVDVWGLVNTTAEIAAAQVALENIEGIGNLSINLKRIPDYAWGV